MSLEFVLDGVMDLSRRAARWTALRTTDCVHQKYLSTVTPTTFTNESADSSVEWPDSCEAGVVISRYVHCTDDVEPERVRVVT